MKMSAVHRLLNKVAIVTGSSSGVGRAIALAYAREGARVVCADLRPGSRPHIVDETTINTDELIKKNGGSAIFVPTDVGDPHRMQNLINDSVSEFGRLDVLVNNAGISVEAHDPQPIHTTPDETWELTMRVNAKSVFLGTKFAIAQMLRQEPHRPSGDRGWIINISSIMGSIAAESIPSYCASKGAVSSLTRQVALEYAKYRIRCNAICPGYTQTAIFAETTSTGKSSLEDLYRKHPFGGPGKPEDIAKFAVVLASDDAAWVSGTNMFVDGGYTAPMAYVKFIYQSTPAGKVPTNGEITFSDLAATVGVRPEALISILRLGIAHRVFGEPRSGVLAHSAVSRKIADDLYMTSWLGADVDDMWPVALRIIDALVKGPHASEPNETVSLRLNNSDQSFHGELAKSPDRARRLGSAMSFFTSGDDFSPRDLTDGYDWASTGSGLVVDLSGSHGDAAFFCSGQEVSESPLDCARAASGSSNSQGGAGS